MSEISTESFTYADQMPKLGDAKEWSGGGMVANDRGDLYGTAPHRIIRSGKVVIDGIRLAGAIAAGWRFVRIGIDPDFAWIERTECERELRDFA